MMIDLCEHVNEIIDEHTGDVICFNCGIIKDRYFQYNTKKLIIDNYKHNPLVNDMLDKINFSEYFADDVNDKISNASSRNLKRIASEIYKIVNEKNSCLTLKTVMNISGLKTNQIKSNDIHILNVENVLEKYTSMLNIDYKTYTVIKEKIKMYKNTGFQPLTIVGGVIYLHSCEIKKKISMKKISSLLGISSISIQRFVKHVFSSRC